GRKQCTGQQRGTEPDGPLHPRASLQDDHLDTPSPSSPVDGMRLSQNASMSRRLPGPLRATIQLPLDRDRQEKRSMPGTAFAGRSGAYRPEQIMEAGQDGWLD